MRIIIGPKLIHIKCENTMHVFKFSSFFNDKCYIARLTYNEIETHKLMVKIKYMRNRSFFFKLRGEERLYQDPLNRNQI